MKGIVIQGLSDTFPSVSNAVTQTYEDEFRLAKRNASGEMRRIGFVGTVIKIECKWSILTNAQFTALVNVVRSRFFSVTFPWNGGSLQKEFYSGNISSSPFLLNDNGTPKYYKDVSLSIISKDAL